MNGERPYVSVIDPLNPAIERVKTILFRPFDLGKWFVIGFCAWLAQLGEGGGPGGGGGGGRGGGGQYRGSPDLDEVLDQAKEGLAVAKEYVVDNLYWIVPVAIFVAVIVITIGLVLAWLSSRGRFMFLHCVAENRAEVVAPWRKFSRHGNSLFVFRIVLGLITFAIIMLALVGGGLFFVTAASSGSGGTALLTLIAVILAIFIISIPLFIIKKFTMDFVVPIMFLRTASCTTAWREFLAVLSVNKARFLLYLLFQIVIALGIGIIVLAACCVTCCIACCIFAIPYVGTVALLPMHVFGRSYSLYYLRQYGPTFDVFRAEEQAALTG
jgi:hypothetical protein